LLVKEKPHAAVDGRSYPLIAQSNCRFTSGQCDLKNNEFRSKMTIDAVKDGSVLELTSSHPLDGVMIRFLENEKSDSSPQAMTSYSDDKRTWRTAFTETVSENTLVRLAMSANNAHYYAETTLAFGNYETSFNKDFRK